MVEKIDSIVAEDLSPVSEKPSIKIQTTKISFSAFQILSVFLALGVTFAVGFLSGVVYDRQQGLAYSDEFEVFWEAWDHIDEDFYQEPPSVTDRVYGGITGVIHSLGDQFSSVHPPVQAETQREIIEGKFGGIGASVAFDEETGETYIVEVVSDACIATTPAENANLQSGDVIRAVDGIDVIGWELGEVVDVVKGDTWCRCNTNDLSPC